MGMPLMHSLSCYKHKIIRKTPINNKIHKTDRFVANSRFVSNNRKIRIPMASLDTRERDNKRVQEDRGLAIDATIVRIMRARKTLLHQQLHAEVLSQLSFFKPEPRFVKRRIEALIEREYVERSSENNNIYTVRVRNDMLNVYMSLYSLTLLVSPFILSTSTVYGISLKIKGCKLTSQSSSVH